MTESEWWFRWSLVVFAYLCLLVYVLRRERRPPPDDELW